MEETFFIDWKREKEEKFRAPCSSAHIYKLYPSLEPSREHLERQQSSFDEAKRRIDWRIHAKNAKIARHLLFIARLDFLSPPILRRQKFQTQKGNRKKTSRLVKDLKKSTANGPLCPIK